jgi:hypothetical protein
MHTLCLAALSIYTWQGKGKKNRVLPVTTEGEPVAA